MIKLLMIFLLFTTFAYAGTSVTKNWAPVPPPIKDDPTAIYDFLNFLYNHFNILQIITTNPNGSTQGHAGEGIIYNNSGTYKVCYETTQPNGKIWKCANLT